MRTGEANKSLHHLTSFTAILREIHAARALHAFERTGKQDWPWPDVCQSFAIEISQSLCALPFSARVLNLVDLGGDPHRGRYPLRVEFEGGKAMIYKPRQAHHESVLFQVLNHIAAETALQWPTPYLIETKSGVWCGVLKADSSFDATGAQQYFYAAGILLAVAFLIGLSDLNHENILAAQGLPLVIDAEFSCQPSMAWFQEEVLVDARQAFEKTVLSTLLLPLPGRLTDPSGLGSARGSSNAMNRTGFAGGSNF